MALTPMYGREKDIEMMQSPLNWPAWPRLPVKRTSKTPGEQIEVGTMLADGEPRVYLVAMFSEIKPDTTPCIDYGDYEAVADDGWVVD